MHSLKAKLKPILLSVLYLLIGVSTDGYANNESSATVFKRAESIYELTEQTKNNMKKITFRGTPITIAGTLPEVGTMAPDFIGVKSDLSEVKLSDYKGKRVLLNIFPSIDTGVCATSVRQFNKLAADLDNTIVINLSYDLPFAMGRFCGAEGIDNAIALSLFRDTNFGKTYGVQMQEGPLKALAARSVIIIDEEGKVIYSELVPEIGQEPDYDNAIAALK